MKLIHVSSESASVEECVKEFQNRFKQLLHPPESYIKDAQINLTFGAFMHLSMTLLVDPTRTGGGLIIEHASGGRDRAIREVLERINARIKNAEVVAFRIGTYTTPVTRRTYAVGVVVFNSIPKVEGERLETSSRRKVIAHVLELFDYNPKVLNISELSRVFGVSRDTIYYDIEQILKERVIPYRKERV